MLSWWRESAHDIRTMAFPDESGQYVRRIISFDVENFPPTERWGLIAAESVHQARSALDHLAYGIFAHEMGDENRDVTFPLYKGGDAKARFADQARPGKVLWWLRKLRPATQSAIERWQPFQLQDERADILIFLDELWNQDKHRAITVAIPSVVPGTPFEWSFPELEAIAPGGKLLLDMPSAPSDEPPFELLFGDDQPVVTTLRKMISCVEEVVQDFAELAAGEEA